jgi:hypothetical protein
MDQKVKFIIRGEGRILSPEENAKLKEKEALEKAVKDGRDNDKADDVQRPAG